MKDKLRTFLDYLQAFLMCVIIVGFFVSAYALMKVAAMILTLRR